MHSITGTEKVSGGEVGWQKEPGHLHSGRTEFSSPHCQLLLGFES